MLSVLNEPYGTHKKVALSIVFGLCISISGIC